MTDKELRHLSRMELISLLLEQTKELNRVQRELEQAKKTIEDRRIRIHNTGSIAEAAMQINQVMEAAQKAADQYIENVKQEYESRARSQYERLQAEMQEMEDDTRAKCEALIKEARRKAGDYGTDG